MGRIAVLSDGGWGTALALVLHGNGHDVRLWGPFPEYIQEMRESRENTRYLPGKPLPESFVLEEDLRRAVADTEQIVLAAPSQYLRGLLEKLARVGLPDGTILVNVAKGIEVGSLKRMSEVVEELLGRVRYAALSGPSHAEEVARGIPTAVVVASRDASIYEAVQEAFSNDFLRVYSSYDITGVELGGALKNVLALAAGICDGMGFGDNTKAAMMTRGIREMARLGAALGGRPETFGGLSGVGDLIVTCMSQHSRNRHVGEQLGRGRELAAVIDEMGGKVAEGVPTAQSAYQLAQRHHVETPIIEQIHAALYEGRDPREAVQALMARSGKPEHP
ncbi:MAG: NAD(P)-dependent glycerol-3-phosphate dehydrogenase [Victivallales bacterium]|jgi:glycerol-3-phosphate dehydrogenase (NAD(P)+)|nr:NAD(P)-dependent glycerol-3-phosphate dehydrogenase [Victivallales bacterium]